MNEGNPQKETYYRYQPSDETVILLTVLVLVLLYLSLPPNHYCVFDQNKAYYTNDLRGVSLNESGTQFGDIVYSSYTKIALVDKPKSDYECQIYFELTENKDE
jgi:hypothetical protein